MPSGLTELVRRRQGESNLDADERCPHAVADAAGRGPDNRGADNLRR